MDQFKEIRILCSSELKRESPGNHYLWGYQSHFLINALTAAEGLFQRLDPTLEPDVCLVAIKIEESDKQPAVVVEPEDHELTPSDFSNVLALANEFQKATPGPAYAYSPGDLAGKRWADQGMRRELFGAVSQSVQQVIAGKFAYGARKIYISAGRELGQYVIFTILMFNAEPLEKLPRLHRDRHGECSVSTSLIDATAKRFVGICWELLPRSFGGDGFVSFPAHDAILRAAASDFFLTVVAACDELCRSCDCYDVCNEIATLTYEKMIGRGRLLFAHPGHQDLTESVTFRNPTSLSNYRAVRKLLELAGGDDALICDSVNVTALGTTCGRYDPTDESLFSVEFVGHSKWHLIHAGVVLMRVEYGVPQLPLGTRKVDQFVESFTRLFPSASEKHRKRMSLVARTLTDLKTGTIIIIRDDAATEAARFGVQAFGIAPVELSEDLLRQAARIDGAVLASPDGVCHAIGVILDGPVSDKGRSDRGARYNSAVRYVLSSKQPCLGLVVSDDGMVDIVPAFRPVVGRRTIQRRIGELVELGDGVFVSRRKLFRIKKWLSAHRFYFSESQCEQINNSLSVANGKLDASGFIITESEFAPHPEMNDSFLQD